MRAAPENGSFPDFRQSDAAHFRRANRCDLSLCREGIANLGETATSTTGGFIARVAGSPPVVA